MKTEIPQSLIMIGKTTVGNGYGRSAELSEKRTMLGEFVRIRRSALLPEGSTAERP